MEVKPASLSICRAFCSPHIVPRPILGGPAFSGQLN
jgi:hypothetical protein